MDILEEDLKYLVTPVSENKDGRSLELESLPGIATNWSHKK
jgi:hypothetical protein